MYRLALIRRDRASGLSDMQESLGVIQVTPD